MGYNNPVKKILEHLIILKDTNRNEAIPDYVKRIELFVPWYEKEVQWACDQIEKVEKSAEVLPSCAKGCNACCRLPIVVTPVEAQAIAYYIKNRLSSDERKLITEQVDNACERISKIDNSHLENLNKKYGSSRKWEDEYRHQYFNANIPCPLLTVDGACAVYPIRPTLCWSYKAYGDPSDCSKNPYVEHAFSYDGLQAVVNLRILIARRKVRDVKLMLLPLALKEVL